MKRREFMAATAVLLVSPRSARAQGTPPGGLPWQLSSFIRLSRTIGSSPSTLASPSIAIGYLLTSSFFKVGSGHDDEAHPLP